MARSAASKAQRAAYARQWRLRHPDYHRRYAERNRERVRAQTRERMRRRREREPGLWRRWPRAARRLPPIDPPYWEEDLRWARLLVDRLVVRDLTRPGEPGEDYYDLVGEALLARVEGRDPEEAVRDEVRRQRRWRYGTVRLKEG